MPDVCGGDLRYTVGSERPNTESVSWSMDVLLADSRIQVRSALWLALEQEPGIRVVGEAPDAETLLALAQALQPDAVLLDWQLPGMDAQGMLARLRALCPGTAIVALSGRPEARRAALGAGADAFVSKVEPPDRFLEAVRLLTRHEENG